MNVFIGCSSKEDIDNSYFIKSKYIINYLSDNNDLVYGGFNEGLMGLSYDIFKKKNRCITGIVNDIYKEDLDKIDCNNKIVTNSTLDRTKKIIEMSDVFIFLPGGVGTYMELFSVLEEIRNYNFDKKIIICNINNYYSGVLSMLEDSVKNRFTSIDIFKYINVINKEEEIKNLI